MKNDSDQLLATRWTLIERLKNWDDQESWRQFFDTYWKLIYGAAIKSGLTHPEAQDVVQETVMSVCKSMHNFKADPAYGSFKAWLLNLTRRRITDQKFRMLLQTDMTVSCTTSWASGWVRPDLMATP